MRKKNHIGPVNAFTRVFLKWTVRVIRPHSLLQIGMLVKKKKTSTIFDLITAHNYSSAQSAQSTSSVVFRLQPVKILSTLLKAYVVVSHLNCIDFAMQFK